MTRYVTGLLGEGISRSLTPPMHRREAELLGLDYEYQVLDTAELGWTVEDTASIIARVRANGFTALNVTHPFKQRVIPYLTELSPDAEQLEAVNLVLFDGDGAVGYNTDWTGFRRAVLSGLEGVELDRIVQIGAGGAGAATAYALLSLGVAELTIADLDPQRAEDLATRYARRFPDQHVASIGMNGVASVLGSARGAVQATPIGMAHSPGVPFDVQLLPVGAWVAEVVYLPLETALLRAARAAGHRVLDGGRMAVGQAADSLRLITGMEPDEQRMRDHFVALVARTAGLDDESAASEAMR